MKKLTTIIMSLALALGLTACSGNTSSGGTSTASGTTSGASSTSNSETADISSDRTSASSAESAENTGSDTGKILVVYYSASGHTEQIAQHIAQAAAADLFEITPAEPYSGTDLNYNDPNSRVSREHNDEALRDVPLTTTAVNGWEDYDTVFIGYPIWWGIAAWPVNGFVKANDFTDKTIIPFATSASSGMGQSGALLSELACTGNWQNGQRFRSSASKDEVTEWVNSLGL